MLTYNFNRVITLSNVLTDDEVGGHEEQGDNESDQEGSEMNE